MPRLSLERLLFRSLSSFKGCSLRAALFLFQSRSIPPAFFFRGVLRYFDVCAFRIVDGMTGGLNPPHMQKKIGRRVFMEFESSVEI